MESGSVPNPIIISICAFFVFFMGLIWFPGLVGDPYSFQIIAFIVIFTIIIALSFYSRHPISGVLISIFIAIAFLCGHITSVATRLLFFSHLWIGDSYQTPNQYITGYWEKILTFEPGSGSLPGILSAVLGLASLGLLAGLIGYIFKNLSIQPSESYPHIFRDYWSQVWSFKKSRAQEYEDWDKRLAGWSILKGSWIQRMRKKIREPRQELIFLPRSNGLGELYDVSANKIVGRELFDYNKSISNYIPKLIHDPTGIANLIPIGKRVRTPPAFRELVGKIANDMAKSYYTLLLFAIPMLSVALGPAIYSFATWGYSEVVINTFLATGIPSIITFVLTIGFWKKSEDLLESRPDEGAFVFSVYLCLFLVYPIILWILFNEPSSFFYIIPYSWVAEWFWGWTVPFLILSGILGFGYIFVHRETENTNVYFFDNRPEAADSGLAPFIKQVEKPPWLDIEEECPDPQNPKETMPWKTKFYWVIRFMYYWRFEVTLHERLKFIPILKFDWERVELWIDAEKDALKWVVSDYHYREAWYKIENPYVNKLPDMFVDIVPNFHTPVPIVDYNEAKKYDDAAKASKKVLAKMVCVSIWNEILNLLRLISSRSFRQKRKEAKNLERNRRETIDKLVDEEEGKDVYLKVLEKLECAEIRYIKGVKKEHDEGEYKGKKFYETESAIVDSAKNP